MNFAILVLEPVLYNRVANYNRTTNFVVYFELNEDVTFHV